MHLQPAVALSLFLASAVPTHARQASAPYPSRHYHAQPSEFLSADDLNAMVLGILGGQPQPALSGSNARQEHMNAAWMHLRGLLNDR